MNLLNYNHRLFVLVSILLLALTLTFVACGDDDDEDDDNNDDQPPDDDTVDDDTGDDDDNDDTGDDDDDDWEPVPPHRETYEGWTIVWLSGTPYEMGFQQGELLHDELAAGYDWLNQYHLIDLLLPLARLLKLTDLAYDNSYPDIIEECQGLVDAAADTGWEMDICMLLNFGDILVEFLTDGYPPALLPFPQACTQFAATGEATTDGSTLHGRSLDWSKIDYLIDYPVVFVRQPSDGIPHAYIGFPGNLSPYSGMNAAGVSLASNEVDPIDNSVHDRVGRSHVQMQAQILKYAGSIDEAREFVESQDHMTVEIIMGADGINNKANVYEMSAANIGVRNFTDDVLYTTNHFNAPETINDDEEAGTGTSLRYLRLSQYLEPDGEDSVWGEIDLETMVTILRDHTNAETGEVYDPYDFDNDRSIATNGAIYQIVFDPGTLRFWAAAGAIPVPLQSFVGFSLGELLGYDDAVPCDPLIIE